MTHAENVAVNYGVPHDLALMLSTSARALKLDYSHVLAVCQQESGFRNVWGHDVGGWSLYKNDVVTPADARAYESAVSRGAGRQGVGPMQITSGGLQAQARGHLADPYATSAVGVRYLAALVREFGKQQGTRRYNGSGPAAEAYARSVLDRAALWHRRFQA